MPAKSVRRRRPVQPPATDGVLARVVDRAFENPAMSGGLVVMALTATAIMSNAMFLQNGRHPEPLFNTRPATVARDAPKEAPLPAARPQAAPVVAPVAKAVPPVPQPKPVVPAPVAAPPIPPAASSATIVAATQRELARLGAYIGPIDGRMGQRTRTAIANYQSTAGLPVTGDASPELLTALKQASAKPVAVAAPLPPAAVAAAKPDQVAAAVERAAELEREQAAARQGDRLRRIQTALNQIGYGPLPSDGQADATTADAIRRFELDNGLPVTGEASDRVIARLVSIGALKAN